MKQMAIVYGQKKKHVPLAFSLVIFSTWMMYFLLYTSVILPSRPLKEPLTISISSSFLTGMERTYREQTK